MKKFTLSIALLYGMYGNAQTQIGNGNMEAWENVGQSTEEPTNWNSFKTGTGSLSSFGSKQVQQSTSIRSGATGSYCARIWSVSTLGVVANGNMTLGIINMGSSTANSSSNYNFSKTADANFSEAITDHPDSIVFWVKFTPASGNPNARMHAILHDAYDFRDPIDANSLPHVVSRAELNYPSTNGQWVRKSVPFVNEGPATNVQFLLVSFTTNQTPGGGAANDEVLIDDVQLIYNPVVTNQPIVASDDAATTNQGAAVTIPVLTNDNDPENHISASSVNIVTQASHGTATANTDGTILYTPNAAYYGADSFVYGVCDSDTPATCDQATVNVTINQSVGVEEVTIVKFAASYANGLIISNTTEKLEVIQMNGAVVYSGSSVELNGKTLLSGLYLVKGNSGAVKVLVP